MSVYQSYTGFHIVVDASTLLGVKKKVTVICFGEFTSNSLQRLMEEVGFPKGTDNRNHALVAHDKVENICNVRLIHRSSGFIRCA